MNIRHRGDKNVPAGGCHFGNQLLNGGIKGGDAGVGGGLAIATVPGGVAAYHGRGGRLLFLVCSVRPLIHACGEEVPNALNTE
jgi:hypothetical protein